MFLWVKNPGTAELSASSEGLSWGRHQGMDWSCGLIPKLDWGGCFEAHMHGSWRCPGTAGHRPETSVSCHTDLSLGQFMSWQLPFFRTSQQEGSSRQKPQSFCHHHFFCVPCTGSRSVGPTPGKGVTQESSGSISEVAWQAVCLSLSDSVKSQLPQSNRRQWIWPVFIAN